MKDSVQYIKQNVLLEGTKTANKIRILGMAITWLKYMFTEQFSVMKDNIIIVHLRNVRPTTKHLLKCSINHNCDLNVGNNKH